MTLPHPGNWVPLSIWYNLLLTSGQPWSTEWRLLGWLLSPICLCGDMPAEDRGCVCIGILIKEKRRGRRNFTWKSETHKNRKKMEYFFLLPCTTQRGWRKDSYCAFPTCLFICHHSYPEASHWLGQRVPYFCKQDQCISSSPLMPKIQGICWCQNGK